MSIYRFPSIPPARLVREAIRGVQLFYLRQGIMPPEIRDLDSDSSPWETIEPVILNFLRHRYTAYDQEIAHEPARRDELRRVITGACYRAYPWLSRDPRPFPPAPERLELDCLAAELEEPHRLCAEIEELLGCRSTPREVRPMLRAQAAEYRAEIAGLTLTLTKERVLDDKVWVSARPTITGSDYDWARNRLFANSIEYAGYRCRQCGQGVYRTKRPVKIGQGRLSIIYSCYCLVALVPVPLAGHKVAPIPAEVWQEKVEAIIAKASALSEQKEKDGSGYED